MKTIITIEVTHDKPIADLIDKIAGRAYTLDGVKDVTAELVEEKPAHDEEAHHAG